MYIHLPSAALGVGVIWHVWLAARLNTCHGASVFTTGVHVAELKHGHACWPSLDEYEYHSEPVRFAARSHSARLRAAL